jgi:DNA-binding CsgD family transcriptional regulator
MARHPVGRTARSIVAAATETPSISAANWVEPPVRLTSRQRELLALLDKRLVNSQIAAALELATPTVKTMLERLYRRANVSNRVELLAWSRAHADP